MALKHLSCAIYGIFFLFLGCATTSEKPLTGIGEIYGTVSDARTRSVLPGVRVTITDLGIYTYSDEDGVYSLKNLNTGSYDLQFLLNGYNDLIREDVEIGYGEHYKMDVVLSAVKAASREQEVLKDTYAEHPREAQPVTQHYPGEEAGEQPSQPEAGQTREVQEGLPVPSAGRRTMPLQAAAHNDNEEYPYFLDYLKRFRGVEDVFHRDFQDRMIVRLTDENESPLFNVTFRIINSLNKELWSSMTYTNGENVLYPHLMFPEANPDKLYVEIQEQGKQVLKKLEISHDRITTVKIFSSESRPDFTLDLLFILDTTGSMCDEIQQLQDNIYSIYTRMTLLLESVPVRLGLILYRDTGDKYLVRKYDFTDDIYAFQLTLDAVKCGGGGDNPEDVQTALHRAVNDMGWRPEACKLSFLIADAPPHTDYHQSYNYIQSALQANQRGIKLYTIGASGLNLAGELSFRQISALTYSEFIFLTYGETGESNGTDIGQVSHHTGSNYQSQRLDDLVVNIVRNEISYQIPVDLADLPPIIPERNERYLDVRLDNLWIQIVKSLNEQLSQEPVAVLAPIKTSHKNLDELAEYVQQMSTIELLSDYGIRIVERDRLEEVLKEHGLSLSGIMSGESYEQLFQLLKSNVIFIGDISYAGLDPVIFMRAVRTLNGELLAAARIRL